MHVRKGNERGSAGAGRCGAELGSRVRGEGKGRAGRMATNNPRP
jgi:hypothetical protein